MEKNIDCGSYYLDMRTRIIQNYCDEYGTAPVDDTLYDLIQTEIVEKC